MLQGFLLGEPCRFTSDGVIHSKDCVTLEVRYRPTVGPVQNPQTVFLSASCLIRMVEEFQHA